MVHLNNQTPFFNSGLVYNDILLGLSLVYVLKEYVSYNMTYSKEYQVDNSSQLILLCIDFLTWSLIELSV